MTLAQIALAVGVTTVLAGWCARRASQTGPTPVTTVYRRQYGTRTATSTSGSAGSRWGRHLARLATRLADTQVGERFETRHRYPLRAANIAVATIAAKTITAAVVGFVTAAVSIALLASVTAIPVVVVVVAPFAIGGLAGWYQLQTIIAAAAARHRQFRAGAAAYIQLGAVCMTTRRSMTEAVTYSADIGTGRAFETIVRARRNGAAASSS